VPTYVTVKTVLSIVKIGPKMALLGSAVIAADSAFSSHNLTVLVGPVLAIILAFFSLRSMQTSIFKTNYEAQKDRAEEAERQRDSHREAKHTALSELAATKLQLEAERRKTDLTGVTEALKRLEDRIDAMAPTPNRGGHNK
jgi:flagellar motility protein MotE (MotC chaperone)